MQQHSNSEVLSALRRLIAQNETAKAWRLIQTLQSRLSDDDSDEHRATVRSYYGFLTARHLKQWEEGREIAESALSSQFYLPETYVNLARVYLDRPIPPYRRKAERLLRDALKIDPNNRAALAEIERLEGGKYQALSFLKPSHPINKFLAKLLGK